MPDPITATVAAVGGSQVIGGIGADKAADVQSDAAKDELELQQYIFEEQKRLLEPYRQAGLPGLEGLAELSTPEGQAAFYGGYYQSPQFQAMANQAQNQVLSSAEATGSLPATTTTNTLARIAPELGMSALQSQLGQYVNLANIGLGGAGSQAAYAGSYGQQAGQTMQNLGAIRAGQAQIPYQVGSQLLNLGANVGYGQATGQGPFGGF